MASERHLLFAVVYLRGDGNWYLWRKYQSLLAAKNEAMIGRVTKMGVKTAVVRAATGEVIWPEGGVPRA
jgi:uncharacterized protein YdbL (DUF1318 family)